MTYFDILCLLNKFFVFFYKSARCVLEAGAFTSRLALRASGPFAPRCASRFFKLRMGGGLDVAILSLNHKVVVSSGSNIKFEMIF